MSKKPAVLLSGLVLLLGVAGLSHAETEMIRGGVLRCGGTNFLRLNGTEIQLTAYDLRNFSSRTPITVERVRIFDSFGAVLLDSRISGLPLFQGGGVPLGPNNNVLGPNQTTELATVPLLPFLPPETRLLQVEFVWSAPTAVPPLEVRVIRIGRERDPSTGAIGADRTRGDFDCRSID
jgi:hypothetical protein